MEYNLCSNCIHECVCVEKDNYGKILNSIKQLVYEKDSSQLVFVKCHCKYYKTESLIKDY